MDFTQDYFSLFDLPRRQAIDALDLERRYQDMQAQVHPDKHAHLGELDRRRAMQWASRVNEAYLTLKSPGKRAEYLLRLQGHDPEIECNTAMPADFLMAQMELREAVEDAREGNDADALDRMHRRQKDEIAARHAELQTAIDDHRDWARAADLVRALMFQEKLLHEIDEALDAVGA